MSGGARAQAPLAKEETTQVGAVGANADTAHTVHLDTKTDAKKAPRPAWPTEHGEPGRHLGEAAPNTQSRTAWTTRDDPHGNSERKASGNDKRPSSAGWTRALRLAAAYAA